MDEQNNTKQQEAPTLFDLDEVADILQLRRRTVWEMIRRGELRAVEVATRRWRVQATDLEAFLASRVVTTDPPPEAA